MAAPATQSQLEARSAEPIVSAALSATCCAPLSAQTSSAPSSSAPHWVIGAGGHLFELAAVIRVTATCWLNLLRRVKNAALFAAPTC